MPDNLDVRRFHERFRVPVRSTPQALETSESEFRVKFMREELDEYDDAVLAGDLEKQFDALLDLVYVAHGTALMQGFPWVEGWRRVQAANMAKIAVRDTNRKGRHEYDVVKPEGWTPADLSDLVRPRTVPLPATMCPRAEGDRCTYPSCDCAVSFAPADEEIARSPLPMVIILEGPDGAGKSTLADALTRATGVRSVHFSAPPKGTSFDETCRQHVREIAATGESAIIDRFHLSEQVYGPIARGVDTMSDDFESLLWEKTRAVVVLCMPPLEETLRNWERRAAVNEEMIARSEQYVAVYNAYRAVRTTLPVIQYDYTRDRATSVLNRLRILSFI